MQFHLARSAELSKILSQLVVPCQNDGRHKQANKKATDVAQFAKNPTSDQEKHPQIIPEVESRTVRFILLV